MKTGTHKDKSKIFC